MGLWSLLKRQANTHHSASGKPARLGQFRSTPNGKGAWTLFYFRPDEQWDTVLPGVALSQGEADIAASSLNRLLESPAVSKRFSTESPSGHRIAVVYGDASMTTWVLSKALDREEDAAEVAAMLNRIFEMRG